ncbi:hypothetical protein DSM106972_033320 [Dulcicalothrix desertica PCC 7102]|uniref:Uncharacterized protein n=1 Tax=Dulcicalothrix desertica PCC 7102 TaxID=232991 RepID=A0A3S5K3B1_9CYAN|nr:hypothetical protein [Dulcicalothrix desertica]RUT06126.1 hypothetical protein DSM106972_033320 [Dulcicalothrix desertica PCC 7102]TWH54214.1 hypothetical protein CAL7102_02226 [Dulcicalothrix desertica PCC 7102]
MNDRLFRKCNLFVVFAILIAQQPQAFAEERIDSCQLNIYEVPRLQLNQITSSDILANSVERVDNQQSLFSARPRLNDLITRPLVWEMRVNKTDLPINANQIQYQVAPERRNGNPFNSVVVKAENFNDAVRSCDEKTAVIRGEVTLEFRDLHRIKPTRTQQQPIPFRANIRVCLKSC